ncbi:MAG TPA: amino acid ABC transporter substrate-binding protein [Casimicrobiaceae bacterium]|jgi:ABC-type amino acid transport substrate-binding protein|nr:amino acid ABC transporter substrate-binding protein [Casimicrobiaceae bacterium]
MSSRLGAGPVQLCIAVCLALCLGTALAATEPLRTLERIRSDGVIRLGYRSNATPFSFRERDMVRGYSVELCDRIAAAIQKQLGLTKLRTEWTPLDAADRLDAVAKGRVDLECGTTSISLSRYEKVDFSLPIFVDGGSVLMTVDAKLTQLKDLGGKRVAVIPGTTTEMALKRELAIVGASAELVPVTDPPAGLALLASGKVVGYAGDRIVLISLRARSDNPAQLVMLESDFSFEPYALVLRRDDPDFRLAVNRALAGIYRSGDIDAIFYRWLGGLGKPGTLLNSMFYLNTLPE